MDKPIELMNADELRAGIIAYHQSLQPAQPVFLPPGVTPGMPEAVKESASQLYAASLLRKSAGALTPDEIAFLRAGVNAALRELGY